MSQPGAALPDVLTQIHVVHIKACVCVVATLVVLLFKF